MWISVCHDIILSCHLANMFSVLDPFLLNVLPRSLVPVAIYITAVAVGSWFVSGYIYRWLLSVIEGSPHKPHVD
jgi:hypothetical protein